MIQRKQSLFLLGSTLLSVLLLYLPVFELESLGGDPGTAKQFDLSVSTLLLILNGAIGILSLVAILMFKNRSLQKRMCNLALLLTCILIGLLFFLADSLSSSTNQKLHYIYGSYIPLFQVVFIFLAIRGIRRDEEMIRSADRLR